MKKRVLLSLSEKAEKKLKSIKAGQRSEFVSYLIIMARRVDLEAFRASDKSW